MVNRGLPLRPTLLTVVVSLIVFGAGTVGFIAYRSSRTIVDDMWETTSEQISQRTMQRTLRYFAPAPPYVEITKSMSKTGVVNPDDPMHMLDYFHGAILANDNFTWASYARKDGTYISVYREQLSRGAAVNIRATWRTAGVGPSGEGFTRKKFKRDNGAWKLIETETTKLVDGKWTELAKAKKRYDPRIRPWYKEAVAGDTGVWVKPFLFATVREPGFMYVAKDLKRDGSLRGVWAVEYEMSYLSRFLASLNVGKSGLVYIVTRDGLVVGHSKGLVTAKKGSKLVIASAANHPDPMLAEAWRELEQRGVRSQRFEFGKYLAMAQNFPEDTGINWLVLVVVPEKDFFGPVRETAMTSVFVGLGAVLIALLLGILFSNNVSNSLGRIAVDMTKIGNFDLSGDRLGDRRSLVRELNTMADATDGMKNSLRSFGRYVPRELVAGLIQSGQEAVLGGSKAELTILFSDIANFTTISEDMDAGDLVNVLGEYLEAMSQEIGLTNGTVDKYIGDAIMAFWGAPNPLADHAVHGCRAALRMQERLLEAQKKWVSEGKPAFSTRIGLSTGEVVVGNIGSPERMNYTVIGDVVNLSSRLEGLNKMYGTQILVGENTASLAGDEFVFRELDSVAVKGKLKAVAIYQLIGERANVSTDVIKGVGIYEQGLAAYRARKFGEAAALFDTACEAFAGDDMPCDVMAARSLRYAEQPPPDDWDGRHVMTEKG